MNKKMKKSAWLDTNVILRFLLKEDPQLFQAVEPLFLQAEQGDLEIYIHPIIIAEIIWTLESYYEYSKEKIAEVMIQLVEAKGVVVPDKEVIVGALQDYKEKNVDFIDSYLVQYANKKGPLTVYTLDKKHFSRLNGDIRVLLNDLE
ncbi:tRNA(fMet)-specific endonuclease VapC [Atribacter laminatus]|jgi:predicted nucleic-acid-binding protein|uniref:tRNA(fMet)-specific endonuclease VapC n=2 Tax=Atribacter laminatus TaxID=2847778 RepID=A0A7T1F222_ATRLM|nr:tRNA(fMet)-specific endonuclease VapC [Atribacter laminatus]